MTLVMTFMVFCAASALKLFPVPNSNKLLMSCFCSLGLGVFPIASSKARKSLGVRQGSESKT